MNNRAQRGFTLVELVVTLAIVALVATLAAPAFSSMIERRRMIGAAELLYTQLQFARTEALKRPANSNPVNLNGGIYVNFTVGPDWVYGISSEGSGCDTAETNPADATACRLVDYEPDGAGNLVAVVDSERLVRVTANDYPGITLAQANFTNDPLAETSFEPMRGLAQAPTPGAAINKNGFVRFTSDNYELRLDLSLLGQVSLCSPAGATYLAGYDECP